LILNSFANNPKKYGKVFIESEKQIKFLEQIKYFLKSISVILSQYLANENILGIYWTNIAPMNCEY